MEYKNFQTFTAEQKGGILTVDINFGPVNVQGQEMLADLSSLCLRLERDRSVKVVVFESSNHSRSLSNTPKFVPENDNCCRNGFFP